MTKTDKKAIFLDIDGTLSQREAAPCAEDVAALRAARAAGHYVFINTGRARGMLPPVLVGVDYLDGYLCGCGTTLILDDKVVFTAEVPRPLLREAIAFYQKSPVNRCLFEAEDGVYMLANDPARKIWTRAKLIRSPEDFETVYSDTHVTKLTVFGGMTPEEETLFAGRLEPILQSSGEWYEAILPGGGKGRGVAKVCERLGIPLENSIAVGDSDNDLDMFQWAGTAVAMEESSPTAVAAADWMTGRCGEGGVARAVNALVFGKGTLKKLK